MLELFLKSSFGLLFEAMFLGALHLLHHLSLLRLSVGLLLIIVARLLHLRLSLSLILRHLAMLLLLLRSLSLLLLGRLLSMASVLSHLLRRHLGLLLLSGDGKLYGALSPVLDHILKLIVIRLKALEIKSDGLSLKISVALSFVHIDFRSEAIHLVMKLICMIIQWHVFSSVPLVENSGRFDLLLV